MGHMRIMNSLTYRSRVRQIMRSAVYCLRPTPIRLRVARIGRSRVVRRRLAPRIVAARIPSRFVRDTRFRIHTSLDDVPQQASTSALLRVSLNNEEHPDFTVITVQGKSKSGLLNSITSLFSDLGLEVMKAEIGTLDGEVFDKFFIVDDVTGGKLMDVKDSENVKKCIETLLASRGKSSGGGTRPDFRRTDETSETLYTLMGQSFPSVSSKHCFRYLHQKRRFEYPTKHRQSRRIHFGTQSFQL